MLITSRDNERVKHARAVRDGKERKNIFIEGVRLCEEAILADLKIVEAFANVTFDSDERGKNLIESLREKAVKINFLSEKIFETVSETKSSQGIVLLASCPKNGVEVLEKDLPQSPLIVVLHKTNNPANAGAIVRVAEAAGARGIIATKGVTYLYSPKALRGSMGSSFRLPMWLGATFDEAIAWCRKHKIKTVCSAPLADVVHTDFDWKQSCALILGEEGSGLTDKEIAAADKAIRIPMCPPVESLNVAVATGILLYEAFRQRCGS